MVILIIMQCFGALVDEALNFPLMPQCFMSHTEVLWYIAFSVGAKMREGRAVETDVE